jgi:hypothetical protein
MRGPHQRAEAAPVSRVQRHAALGWPWGDRRQHHPDRSLLGIATDLRSQPPRLETQTGRERQKSHMQAESDGLNKRIANLERAILRRKVTRSPRAPATSRNASLPPRRWLRIADRELHLAIPESSNRCHQAQIRRDKLGPPELFLRSFGVRSENYPSVPISPISRSSANMWIKYF